MAWCPFAEKLELQPESDQQPAIRPTQMIVHSIVAPWTAQRLYEYWKSTALESHFGIGYAGDIAQYIGSQTRADANYRANRRPDGTGALSAETASNTSASDPWTDAQVEALIRLGVWAHQHPAHSIPLRLCRTWDDPGFGWHRMFPEWAAGGGTACPGTKRIEQFKTVVFPGIVARATGKNPPPEEEADMALTDADLDKIARLVWAFSGDDPLQGGDAKVSKERLLWGIASRLARVEKAVDGLDAVDLTDEQVEAIGVTIAANPNLAEQIAEKVAAKLATRLAE